MPKVIVFCWNVEHHAKPIRMMYFQWLLHQHISDAAFVT